MGHTAPVNRVCYSPSGQLVASCSSDKTVRLWVPNARGESVVLNGHSASVRCVDFSHSNFSSKTNSSSNDSPDLSEALLVTCSDDKTVKVWNLPQKSFRCSLLGHTNWVRTCKFSPDTSHICASGGDDGTLRLWDVERHNSIVTLDFTGRSHAESMRPDGVSKSVRHLEFHPSATSLAASTTDGTIELYDLRCDKIIQHYDLFKGQSCKETHPKFAPPVSFHPSGHYMLCGGGENILDIWDVRKGRLMSEIKINGKEDKSKENKKKSPSFPSSVTFSTDGTHFACTGSDKEILVWSSDFSNDDDNPIITKPSNGRYINKKVNYESKLYGSNSTSTQSESQPKNIQTITPELEYVAEDILDDRGENDYIGNQTLQKKNTSQETNSQMTNCSSFDNPSTNRITNQSFYDVRFPSLLEGTLEQIVGQLSIITQTLELLDKRLSTQEDTMKVLTKEWADSKLEKQQRDTI